VMPTMRRRHEYRPPRLTFEQKQDKLCALLFAGEMEPKVAEYLTRLNKAECLPGWKGPRSRRRHRKQAQAILRGEVNA
jgi:hypothetical protein